LFTGGLDKKRRDKNAIDVLSVEDIADGRGLEKTTIDPRRMGKLLKIFAASRGARTLPSVIADWVKGIERPRDREILTTLLDNYTFIDVDGKVKSLLGNEKEVS